MAECAVLLVDDNEDAREAVAYLLKTMTSVERVVCVDDGLAALQELRSGLRPCLILLDFLTPRMDARAFRVEQVADPALRDIPVVLCSGLSDLPQIAAELDLAPDQSLTKPIMFDRLMELVARYCGRVPLESK